MSDPDKYAAYFAISGSDEIIGYIETKSDEGLRYKGKHYGVLTYNFYNFGYHFSTSDTCFELTHSKAKLLIEQNYTIEEALAND